MSDIEIPAVVGEVGPEQEEHDGYDSQHQSVRFKLAAAEKLAGIKPTEGGQVLEPGQFLTHACINTNKIKPQDQPDRHRSHPTRCF